jgi:hypothetical protein
MSILEVLGCYAPASRGKDADRGDPHRKIRTPSGPRAGRTTGKPHGRARPVTTKCESADVLDMFGSRGPRAAPVMPPAHCVSGGNSIEANSQCTGIAGVVNFLMRQDAPRRIYNALKAHAVGIAVPWQ